jgi:hypothetical protein
MFEVSFDMIKNAQKVNKTYTKKIIEEYAEIHNEFEDL